TEISPESVESAIKLVDYFKSHARKTYDSMNSSSSDKSVIKAVEWIRKKGGQVTVRQFYTNKVAACKTAPDAMALLGELVDRKMGSFSQSNTEASGNKVIYFTLRENYRSNKF
ncbi:MAG: hypothetical protein PHD97_00795, partial [Bacteroidales bacterium]|nr:hypothetical protein [Bacteroidales bacterium]